MADNITLATLRSRVRQRGEYRSPYISDAELTDYINSSIKHLRDVMVEHDPSRFLTQGSISVVSGTESYSLPATFYKLISVNIPYSSSASGYIVAERINWQDRHRFSGAAPSSKESTYYAIRGSSIYFWPTPTWTDTVQLEYIPTFTALSASGDTFDGINGWQEWVINDVLIKCANKADDDPRVWERRRAYEEERILRAGDIDHAQPKTVSAVNVHYGYRGRRSSRVLVR